MPPHKLLRLLEVLLRVPPLLIIDELFKSRGYLPHSNENSIFEVVSGFDFIGSDHYVSKRTPFYFDVFDYSTLKLFFNKCLRFLLTLTGCLAASCIFMLWTKHLMILYLYLISVFTILLSYWANVAIIETVLENGTYFQNSIVEDILSLKLDSLTDINSCSYVLLQNYVLQFVLAAVFLLSNQGPKYPILEHLLTMSFLAPTTLVFLPRPAYILHHAPVFATLLPLALVKFTLWSGFIPVIQILYKGYQHAHNYISNYGLSTLLEDEWQRLEVPNVLRTFWLIRVAEHLSGILFSFWMSNDSNNILQNDSILPDILAAIKSLLITGCETLTAVLGMTSIISFIFHYIGCFFQWILLTGDEDDKSIGTVSAVLFFILALQTGLTGLEPEKRFIRLCRNFCLLLTALLHFVHNIVNPILMSLSASHNPAIHRHIRALGVCFFLILYPVTLLSYLWTYHSISTWLLAVSVFSIEVIVKVVVSLLIYILFLIDAYRSSFWEKLDDYVYYIKAFGNTVEFCFGIFLFFNGAWILFFESGGAIRAGMMGVHAYFNIWTEARTGWNIFLKRRTAVNKIDSLPDATTEQLTILNDVCAICYQEMNTAKITRCNHYFHGVCLRKWLYLQDRCPLCHFILYRIEESKEDNLPPEFQELIREYQAR